MVGSERRELPAHEHPSAVAFRNWTPRHDLARNPVRGVLRRVVSLWRDADLRRWRNHPYISDAAPVIVGGCGRSGTTIFRVILDTHPNMCCGPESVLFAPRWPRLDTLTGRFMTDEGTVREMLDRSRSQASFIDEFFQRYAAARGKPRWAEKTPANVRHLGFTFEHFPKARFVHVIRDGRDVVCSLRTHPRYAVVDGEMVELHTSNPIEQCIDRWVRDVRAGLRFRKDPRYTEVKYEDLVSRPRETVQRICGFIGEEFHEGMLRFYEVREQSRNYVHFAQTPEATMPIYTHSVSRWRTELGPDDIALFKKQAGGLLNHLGYAEDEMG